MKPGGAKAPIAEWDGAEREHFSCGIQDLVGFDIGFGAKDDGHDGVAIFLFAIAAHRTRQHARDRKAQGTATDAVGTGGVVGARDDLVGIGRSCLVGLVELALVEVVLDHEAIGDGERRF